MSRFRHRLLLIGLALGTIFLIAVILADYGTDGRQRLGNEAGWLVALALVLAGVFALMVRHELLVLEKLADAAEKMATGTEVEIPGEDRQDEIGSLAGSLVWLRHHMQDQTGQRLRELERLRAVIESIPLGVALVGSDRRVHLANDAIRLMARQESPVGRAISEIVRTPQLLEALETCLERGEPQHLTFQSQAVTAESFEARVIPFDSDSTDRAALLVIQDVSRLESLERVRREFVSNVSHEMRTPLTSIKGAVETLIDGGAASEPALRDRLLTIARRQALRLEALVSDLSDLSQIETGAVRLQPAALNLASLCLDVAKQFGAAAEEQAIRIEVDVTSDLWFRGDPRRTEQVLVNLVDNAVKFNRPGGKVSLVGSRHDDRIELQVSDTGVGIPFDSLDKVFQRFYRVDNSRSKDAPGTGLGLAIVKHLMRLQGGSITVESELGRGSTFRLLFPPAEVPRKRGLAEAGPEEVA